MVNSINTIIIGAIPNSLGSIFFCASGLHIDRISGKTASKNLCFTIFVAGSKVTQIKMFFEQA